jgi:hypothetical protein
VPWARLQEKLNPRVPYLYPTDGLILTPKHGALRCLNSEERVLETVPLSVLKWKPLVTVDFLLSFAAAPSRLGDKYVMFLLFVQGVSSNSSDSGAVKEVAVEQLQQRHIVQKDHFEFSSKILPNYLDIAKSDMREKKLDVQRLLSEVAELAYDAAAGVWRFVRARPDKSKANTATMIAKLSSMLVSPVPELALEMKSDPVAEVVKGVPSVASSPSSPPPSQSPSHESSGHTDALDLRALCQRHGAIKNLLYSLAEGKHVADVCSGRGADISRWVQNNIASVISIEKDPTAVHQAKLKLMKEVNSLCSSFDLIIMVFKIVRNFIILFIVLAKYLHLISHLFTTVIRYELLTSTVIDNITVTI